MKQSWPDQAEAISGVNKRVTGRTRVFKERTWNTDKPRKHDGSRTAKLVEVLRPHINKPFQNILHQKIRLKELAMAIVMLNGRIVGDPIRRLASVQKVLESHFSLQARLNDCNQIEIYSGEQSDAVRSETLWSEADG